MAIQSSGGSRSPSRVLAALTAAVEAIRTALAEEVPGLQGIDDLVLVQLARTVVELDMMQKFMDDHSGPFDSRGRPAGLWRQYSATHTRFMRYCAMLGISPAGRAAVLRDSGAAQREYLALQAQRELQERYVAKALPEETEPDE
jgi:hypothetical protein